MCACMYVPAYVRTYVCRYTCNVYATCSLHAFASSFILLEIFVSEGWHLLDFTARGVGSGARCILGHMERGHRGTHKKCLSSGAVRSNAGQNQ